MHNAVLCAASQVTGVILGVITPLPTRIFSLVHQTFMSCYFTLLPPKQCVGMIAEDGGDGSLEDFSGIKLTNEKVMDKLYLKARPGSDLNLAKDEIAMFKKCKTHEEVENCLRQVLLDRFRAYKKNGLAGVKPYSRSKEEFSPGGELKAQLEAGKILQKRSMYSISLPLNIQTTNLKGWRKVSFG